MAHSCGGTSTSEACRHVLYASIVSNYSDESSQDETRSRTNENIV